MKKLLLVFGVLIAGSPFVSCKKMKDDIKDLKNQVNNLKSENDTLKNQLDGVENLIGSDEPILATTTFQDSAGAPKTVSGVYKFKSIDYDANSMVKNTDGTYEIYVSRYASVGGGNGTNIYFNYNPTTKAATQIEATHRWADADPYMDMARYYSSTAAGLTMSVTVDSLNLTTGATSIKFAATGTAAYTNSGAGYYSPMHGKPVATNITFVGKLKLFSTK